MSGAESRVNLELTRIIQFYRFACTIVRQVPFALMDPEAVWYRIRQGSDGGDVP